MPIKTIDYPIKVYTKKELAEMYEVEPRVFRAWCKKAKLDFGRSNYLTPKQVRQVFEAFGTPEKKEGD